MIVCKVAMGRSGRKDASNAHPVRLWGIRLPPEVSGLRVLLPPILEMDDRLGASKAGLGFPVLNQLVSHFPLLLGVS
jgi:hypothetical protein